MPIAELRDAPKQNYDLPGDTWGCAIFVIIKDMHLVLGGKASKAHLLRFLFVMTCLIVNLAVQFAMVIWTNEYIVQFSVQQMQSQYEAYHASVFDTSGVFHHAQWEAFDGRDSICQAGMTKMFFLASILLLWSVRMLGELRLTAQLDHRIRELPNAPHDADPHDMMMENHDEEVSTYEVICLTGSTRFVLRLFIIVPKLIIAAFLLYMGCRFLASTQSFADIIMNAMALEFIINIDELIFDCLMPEILYLKVSNMKFAPPKIKLTPEQHENEIVRAYTRSMFYILLLIAFVWVYLNSLQQVIPGFKHDIGDHCSDYIESQMTTACPQITIWPFTKSECFPYGTEEDVAGTNMSDAFGAAHTGGAHHGRR
eukprot:gnl/TRDRNA2_/TRDRNA2_76878_c0_seq1.p1 gnl/TRDRNA2_/TRDRNA2_76878_c0~~gnl/TRDRNA2_/TRDRNA2_76878_c0_seq1.p1  ORF type:complete len:422 (-),score=69.43 gnl/TRDRNA2_/TRDRNA2_76878_c0_seq1:18-1124(-)